MTPDDLVALYALLSKMFRDGRSNLSSLDLSNLIESRRLVARELRNQGLGGLVDSLETHL